MFPLAWMSGQWLEFDTADGTTRTVDVSDEAVARDERRVEPPLRRWAAARALRNHPARLEELLARADGMPPRHRDALLHDGRGRKWGEPPVQDGGGYIAAAFADEEEADLGKVLRAEGAVLEYVYDFGDSWLHRIEAEKIMPLDPGVTYPRCTGGRRAAPPAEDIGGIWGLEEVVYLVTHPEADPPEHFEDLVCHLREKGYAPGAFDPGELTVRLSGLTVRTAAKATRPGMLSMLAEQFDSVVFPVLKLLYRLPGEQWLDTGSLMPPPGADADRFGTELNGWLAGRDEASAVTQLLQAVPGTDPDLAGRRVAAIAVLTKIKPDDARTILRGTAANGPDGRRHVAAGVLANLGEEPPLYQDTTQQWLLIDLLTALRAGNLSENLTHDLMETIRSHVDDLWRSDHPATAGTIEATAAALRDTDKALVKRLRRSAHKARTRR